MPGWSSLSGKASSISAAQDVCLPWAGCACQPVARHVATHETEESGLVSHGGLGAQCSQSQPHHPNACPQLHYALPCRHTELGIVKMGSLRTGAACPGKLRQQMQRATHRGRGNAAVPPRWVEHSHCFAALVLVQGALHVSQQHLTAVRACLQRCLWAGQPDTSTAPVPHPMHRPPLQAWQQSGCVAALHKTLSS